MCAQICLRLSMKANYKTIAMEGKAIFIAVSLSSDHHYAPKEAKRSSVYYVSVRFALMHFTRLLHFQLRMESENATFFSFVGKVLSFYGFE